MIQPSGRYMPASHSILTALCAMLLCASALGLTPSPTQTVTEVRYAGRVVGPDGELLTDALVVFVPVADGRWLDDADLAEPLARRPHLEGRRWNGFSGSDIDKAAGCRVDADGRFELRVRPSTPSDVAWYLGPPRDDDLLLIWAPGQAARTETLVTHDLAVSMDLGDLELQPAARLTARLVDELDGALAGLPIRWSRQQIECWPTDGEGHRMEAAREGWLETDADGRLSLEHLWPGEIRLHVLREDRVPLETPVALRSGELTDLGDVLLRRGGTIAGRVIDWRGQPVEGASVVVASQRPTDAPGLGTSGDHDPTGARIPADGDTHAVEWAVLQVERARDQTTTDSEGRFVITGLLEQQHLLYVTPRADSLPRMLAMAEPLVLEAVPTDGDDLELTLRRADQLLVRLVDGSTGALLDDHPRGLQAWRLAMPGFHSDVDVPLVVRRSDRDDISVVIDGVGPSTELWVPQRGASRRIDFMLGRIGDLVGEQFNRAEGQTLRLVEGLVPGEQRVVEVVIDVEGR